MSSSTLPAGLIPQAAWVQGIEQIQQIDPARFLFPMPAWALKTLHQAQVAEALHQGQCVPAEVLNDYPEPDIIDDQERREWLAGLKAEQQRYLTGPIICWPGGWGRDTPAWLRTAISNARICLVEAERLDIVPGDLATLEEAAAYYFTAAHCFPSQAKTPTYFCGSRRPCCCDTTAARFRPLRRWQPFWTMIRPTGCKSVIIYAASTWGGC